MINNVVAIPSSSNTTYALTMAGMLSSTCPDLRHSIFSAQIVNRTAFGGDTWVTNIGATDHIVHSIHLLTDFTAINCMVDLPNGETALETHIGFICLSKNLILNNVLCVPSFC